MAKNILIPFLMLILSALSAATYTVPGDYAAIQAAISTTIDGDSIIVAPGFYYENIDFLMISLRLTNFNDLINAPPSGASGEIARFAKCLKLCVYYQSDSLNRCRFNGTSAMFFPKQIHL